MSLVCIESFVVNFNAAARLARPKSEIEGEIESEWANERVHVKQPCPTSQVIEIDSYAPYSRPPATLKIQQQRPQKKKK